MESLDVPAVRGNSSMELGKYQVESGSSTDNTREESSGYPPPSSLSQAPIAAEPPVSPSGNDDRNHVQELRGVRRFTGLEPTGLKYAGTHVTTSRRLQLTIAGVASMNAMSI